MRRPFVIIGFLISATSAAIGEDTPWSKLVGLIQHDQERLVSRKAAVGLACSLADDAGVAQLLSMAAVWMHDIDQSGLTGDQLARDSALSAKCQLVNALVCENGAPRCGMQRFSLVAGLLDTRGHTRMGQPRRQGDGVSADRRQSQFGQYAS